MFRLPGTDSGEGMAEPLHDLCPPPQALLRRIRESSQSNYFQEEFIFVRSVCPPYSIQDPVRQHCDQTEVTTKSERCL